MRLDAAGTAAAFAVGGIEAVTVAHGIAAENAAQAVRCTQPGHGGAPGKGRCQADPVRPGCLRAGMSTPLGLPGQSPETTRAFLVQAGKVLGP